MELQEGGIRGAFFIISQVKFHRNNLKINRLW